MTDSIKRREWDEYQIVTKRPGRPSYEVVRFPSYSAHSREQLEGIIAKQTTSLSLGWKFKIQKRHVVQDMTDWELE